MTHEVSDELDTTIAGLRTVITHAPSDSDDSTTIWFPDLGVCVNNLVWPTLFNVFAIRGEEYRDPRILLEGLDHIASLEAEHLVGAHGQPISGQATVAAEIENYRDSIQFLWDQTVRGANNGLSLDELTEAVQLPDLFSESTITRQHYGVVEHHVRQIHSGLFGWFDEDPEHLFPLPRAERAQRLIAGFGGADEVARQCDAAVGDGDLRWAIELASWLVVAEPESEEQGRRLAAPLRAIAQRTTSQNVRNWCLTRALSLEGVVDVSRFSGLRIRPDEVLAASPDTYVRVMRVLLDPDRTAGVNQHVAVAFDDGTVAGLHVRRCVAVPTSGSDAEITLTIGHADWAQVLGGKLSLRDALASGSASASDAAATLAFFAMFDHRSFATAT